MHNNSSEKNIPVSKNYQENVDYLNKELGVPDSFDIVVREMSIGGKRVAIYSVNGMVNTQVASMIIDALIDLERSDLIVNALEKLVKGRIVNLQVSEVQTMDKVFYFMLSGPMAIFVEGQDKAIIVDIRTYPARTPQEPDIERVTRGSRDGFTETLVMNTALIRRRLRDPKLRMKLVQVGGRSKTDVCIAYIEDITNLDMVQKIQKDVQGIKVDGIPMAEKSVEEFILGSKFWNPYPRVRYTERPDVAAVHLLEGYVILIVDTSPSVMIAPSTFWSHVQHAEEYRQEPVVGAYLRWVRFAGIFAALFLLPLWLGAALNPQSLPDWLAFIGVTKPAKVSLLVQVILAEVGVDLLRLGTIHTPGPLGTALGLIAAFMLGDIAVKVGLFTPEVVLYIAIASVGTFATPSYELGLANRISRLFLVIMTGLFNFIGFWVGVAALFFLLWRTKSFDVPYLWPLLPFNYDAMKRILVRSPVTLKNQRPGITKPQDQDRQPQGSGK
ncbi:spore germination protein, GerA family [Desulfosporosinus orientis DSM 765]|uniref:Spore germination protein, GerA family n=1 Tax=Desulfosporosinus orientis (strain ATCC 19365 / DSM 765 / NCIMB 8382 / VKM B-1628 / Singapore I) TaxID=768706 RepID=G7WAI3_DESOD|nr:spore germination protein [Desulfosporosinus orientis]AET66751.1 spore germination protein, GerA family [Desulfosporosinus orientis DSM 765]